MSDLVLEDIPAENSGGPSASVPDGPSASVPDGPSASVPDGPSASVPDGPSLDIVNVAAPKLPRLHRQGTQMMPHRETIDEPIPVNDNMASISKYETITIPAMFNMRPTDYLNIQHFMQLENTIFIIGIMLLIVAFATATTINYTKYKTTANIDPTYNLFLTMFRVSITALVMGVSFGMTYYSNKKDKILIPYLKNATYKTKQRTNEILKNMGNGHS
jgi:hypothetical protein